MAELTIPKEHQILLNKIRTLPETSVDALVAALERFPGSALAVQGLAPEEASAIQRGVLELYDVREFLDLETPEFVAEIASGMQEIAGATTIDVREFKERLTKLLTIDSVGIWSKAESLKMEYERRFCTARILTDARPVYGDDPSKPPSAGMIIHTLRISFHDNTSQLREFYLSMDTDDLKALRELLDRAEMKAQSLESVFTAAKIGIIAP